MLTTNGGRRIGGAALIAAAFVIGVFWGATGGTSAAQHAAGAQAVQDPPGAAPAQDPPGAAPVQDAADAAAVEDPTGAAANQDTPRVFSANTGIVLNYLKAGQNTAFERTMKRVGEALATSDRRDRRRQAAGWKIYKAEEPLDGGILLYISVLDPVVPGADYWVPQILNEAFPTEVQELYDDYVGAFADGQILLNLSPVLAP